MGRFSRDPENEGPLHRQVLADLPEGRRPAGSSVRRSTDRPTLRPPRRLATFRALEHANFRLFFPWYAVSLIGIWLQRTALGWLVVDVTGSAFYVGLTESLGTLPVLVFTLYAGAVADRVRKERMVLGTQIAGAVLAMAFAGLVFVDAATIERILLLAFLTGVMVAFDIPARQSFLLELVGREDVGNAIALNASVFSASRVVGPAVAGTLIGAVGVGACFLLNSLSYVPVMIVLLVMRLPADRKRATGRSTFRNMTEGIRYVAGDPRLSRIVVNVAALGIFGLSAFVLLPVLARNEMGLGAKEYGWMMSAVGLGAVVGALGVATLIQRLPKGRVLGAAAVLFGLMLLSLAVVRSLPLILLFLTGSGLAMIVTTALTNTLLQTLAPDELRGRVVSVYTVSFLGMAPAGALLMGAVGEALGLAAAFGLGGVVVTVIAVVTVFRSGVVRQAD